MRLFLTFFALCFFSLSVFAEEPQFFVSLDDVPLMEGFSEVDETAISFDKPEGRIVEVQAVAENLDQENVYRYYRQILPQFGWKDMGGNSFFREDEKLVLSCEKDNGYMVLTVSLMPR